MGEYEYLRNDEGMITFVKKDQDERIRVMLNFSDQPRALEVSPDAELLLATKQTSFESGKIFENEAMIIKEDL
ncbi:hypothetical protein RCG23_14130 [Neobacillus sp. PS3-34]|uniref:alpha-glucosidase C-terminal domain-containing protein n=1 Tax=Neobacillus sp. PS3-34 TaxID=3070678 RepID=UPI0027DF287E|nr:alpha-glucosidase C-terminal domain-containing protein [Neobacillus sp. PS3-34]WML50616.1 hypothetical protein RCG23_14130 [Neobacillus sp. PS3-34]